MFYVKDSSYAWIILLRNNYPSIGGILNIKHNADVIKHIDYNIGSNYLH